MKVITNIKDIKKYINNSVITIGNFDGLHKGHQYLINKTEKIAKEYNSKSVAITFYPHPQVIFGNDTSFKAIYSLKDKILSFSENTNIDFLCIIKFKEDIYNLSAKDFIDKVVIKNFNPLAIIIGEDFIFGKNKSGDINLLNKLSLKYKYQLFTINKLKCKNNDFFSSTNIRKHIANGDIETVNKCLGYKYFYTGRVSHGLELARKLGFPTLNIKYNGNIKYGVYAVYVYINNIKYKAIANIGIKPTINIKNPKPLLEVHILNQIIGNIYGEKIKVEFVTFIRGENKFQNIESLKEQINLDIKKVYAYF